MSVNKPHLVKIIGGNEWACYTSRDTFSAKVGFGETPLRAYIATFGISRTMLAFRRSVPMPGESLADFYDRPMYQPLQGMGY